MNIIRPNLDGSRLRIDVMRARPTNGIGSKVLEACRHTLKELDVIDKNTTAVAVSGALEMLLALQNIAASNQCDALIAISVIVRGETYHFELVFDESSAGVTHVDFDHDIPIANTILITENGDQAVARIEEKASNTAKVAIGRANLVNLLLEGRFNEEDE